MEVNHGTWYYFMAFRSSAQCSCLALAVRSPKLTDKESLVQPAVVDDAAAFVCGERIILGSAAPLTMLGSTHIHATDHRSLL
jgi:hypothetical protein